MDEPLLDDEHRGSLRFVKVPGRRTHIRTNSCAARLTVTPSHAPCRSVANWTNIQSWIKIHHTRSQSDACGN